MTIEELADRIYALSASELRRLNDELRRRGFPGIGGLATVIPPPSSPPPLASPAPDLSDSLE